jgi:hypothetical protein
MTKENGMVKADFPVLIVMYFERLGGVFDFEKLQ